MSLSSLPAPSHTVETSICSFVSRDDVIYCIKRNEAFLERRRKSRINFGNSESCGSGAQCPHKIQQTKQDTFHGFSELPKELRLLILEEHIRTQESRTLVLYCQQLETESISTTDLPGITPLEIEANFNSQSAGDPPPGFPWELRAKSLSIPSLLHVNHWCREVAQKFYQLSFGWQLGGRGIWFNFERDLLLMDTAGAYSLFRYGIQNNTRDQEECEYVDQRLRFLALQNLGAIEFVAAQLLPEWFYRLRRVYIELVSFCSMPSNLNHSLQALRRDIRNYPHPKGSEGSLAEISILKPRGFARKVGVPFEERKPTCSEMTADNPRNSPSFTEIEWARQDSIAQLNLRKMAANEGQSKGTLASPPLIKGRNSGSEQGI